MSTPQLTLEAAAAQIHQQVEQAQAAENQAHSEELVKQREKILAMFHTHYAEVLPLLAASSVKVEIAESEASEHGWADLVFTKTNEPQVRQVRFVVTGFSESGQQITIGKYAMSKDDLILSLANAFEKAAKPLPRPAATPPKNTSAQAAFARPIGNNGRPSYEDAYSSDEQAGLTKLEYFAARAMQGLLAAKHNPATLPIFAVQVAQQVIAEIDKA